METARLKAANRGKFQDPDVIDFFIGLNPRLWGVATVDLARIGLTVLLRKSKTRKEQAARLDFPNQAAACPHPMGMCDQTISRQSPFLVIPLKADRKSANRAYTDAKVQRRYERLLRTLTDDEHQLALRKYQELQDRFPELRMREAYIAAASMVRYRHPTGITSIELE